MLVDNRNMFLNNLKDMNEFAKLKSIPPQPIYLLGNVACIIANYADIMPTNIELLDMNYSLDTYRLIRLLGNYNVCDLFVTPIAPKFEERVLVIDTYDYININVLSIEDIIISKLGRFTPMDKELIDHLIPKANIKLLNDLIDSFLNKKNFSEIIKTDFVNHLKEFKEIYNV